MDAIIGEKFLTLTYVTSDKLDATFCPFIYL